MLLEIQENYVTLIKESTSLSEVCRKANISITNGNFISLKRIINENNIDASHFKKQPNQTKYQKHDIKCYLNNENKISSSKLKDKLFKEDLKNKKCECCGGIEWMNKPIPLELHHINGNNDDNNLDNLQILCSNCHAQTDNYGGKNIAKKNTEKICPVCEKIFHSKKAKYCSTNCKTVGHYGCSILTENMIIDAVNKASSFEELSILLNRSKRNCRLQLKKYNIIFKPIKPNYVNEEFLLLLKKLRSFSSLSKILNISETAIRKRLKAKGLPYHIKDILNYLDNYKGPLSALAHNQ